MRFPRKEGVSSWKEAMNQLPKAETCQWHAKAFLWLVNLHCFWVTNDPVSPSHWDRCLRTGRLWTVRTYVWTPRNCEQDAGDLKDGNLGVSNGALDKERHGWIEWAASQYKQRSGLVWAAWGRNEQASFWFARMWKVENVLVGLS